MRVCTIGYEGADIDDFLDTLDAAGVTHLIDVRELPASRRPNFSKNALRENLEDAGIDYTHFRALGDPKPGRDAMRRGDREAFEAIFAEQMAKPEAQDALAELISIAEEETVVLLCYERDPKTCHRTIVAERMSKNKPFKTQHLGVNPRPRRRKRGASIGEHQSAY